MSRRLLLIANHVAQDQVVVEQVGDGIVLVTICGVTEDNLINLEIILKLNQEIQNLDLDGAVRCIILRGKGQNFSAGSVQVDRELYNECLRIIPWVNTPIIAAVQGKCMREGFQLALMCDIIVPTTSAQFALNEIQSGDLPALGGSNRFVSQVKKSNASLYMLTGWTFDVVKAKQMKLIREYYEGDATESAIKLAQVIAQKSLPALQFAKKAIRMSQETGLTQGLMYEYSLFMAMLNNNDKTEGIKALLEKRKPAFTHS